MTLEKFETLCKKHDWYYARSESSTIYNKGKTEREVIHEALRVGGKQFEEVYKRYSR